jgi:hypothetical protein
MIKYGCRGGPDAVPCASRLRFLCAFPALPAYNEPSVQITASTAPHRPPASAMLRRTAGCEHRTERGTSETRPASRWQEQHRGVGEALLDTCEEGEDQCQLSHPEDIRRGAAQPASSGRRSLSMVHMNITTNTPTRGSSAKGSRGSDLTAFPPILRGFVGIGSRTPALKDSVSDARIRMRRGYLSGSSRSSRG